MTDTSSRWPAHAHARLHVRAAVAALICATCTSASSSARSWAAFRIDCVDAETGRGVPLVRLATSNYINYHSDSAGVVAFDEPGLLGLSV